QPHLRRDPDLALPPRIDAPAHDVVRVSAHQGAVEHHVGEPRVKWIAIGVKVAISGLLAWLVLKHVDFAAAGALLRSERGLVAFLLAMGVLAGQAVIAGARTACVMRLLGVRCSIRRGIAVWMVGLVVSQSLITFIAGDAARVWQFVRLGYPPR